ncbi:MAG: FGGY-family carbohydrate kinase, partial [Dehalococcoidia bacterium]
ALENLAFAVKGNYLQLRQISGFKDPEVWLSGGISKISAFSQLVADTLDVSVQVPETGDASLLGTAMCAAVGAGAYGSLREAALQMRGPTSTISPIPDRVGYLGERYERWWSLYQKLEGLSEGL